jgi:RND family efflux transporter MFP subunit
MMRKKYLIYISLTPFVMLTLIGCKPDTAANGNQKKIAVIVEPIGEHLIDNHIAVSGNVEGNTTVKLGFMVAGKIDRIAIREGQNVQRGSLVASLDATNYGLAKELADVNVLQARDEYTRLKTMFDRNSISESDFKKITYTLQAAEAQQKLQTKNVADTKLYAPISGVLIKKLAEVGEIVSAGMPVLVIADIQTVNVNAYIPENQLNDVRIGQLAQVYVSALDTTYQGKVVEVGSVADAITRAFTIKIEIKNPSLSIRPGMIAEVKIPSIKSKQVLSIPTHALLKTPEGQPYVFIVSRAQAFQRNISIGGIYGDQVEILSGLNATDTLVIGGQHKLTNGSNILITAK